MGRRRIALVLGAATLVVGIGAVPAPASADPLLNAAAAYAVNVPGSVLVAAAPDAARAAVLANGQAYNWTFSGAAYATVSGTATATPAAVTTLAPAEQAAWESLVARFGAPATAPSSLAKGSLPVLSFSVGMIIGNVGARLMGFTDDDVCQTQDDVLIAVASVLNGVDCSVYSNAIPEPSRNADQMVVQPGSTQCITQYNYCWTFVGSAPYALNQQLRQLCFTWTGTLPTGYHYTSARVTMEDGSQHTGSSHSGGVFGYCDDVFGAGVDAAAWPVAFHKAIASWRLRVSNGQTELFSTGHSYSSGDWEIPNPDRYWRCEIRTTDNQIYTASSDAFGEADGTLAAVVCPEVPAGKIVNRVRLYEVFGSISTLVYSQNVTGAYGSWAVAFPECRNGSCLLDLRQSGQSCFTDGIDCDGWFTDPNRDAIYTCRYGTHAVALSECYLYAESFDPDNQESGHGYADPGTGAPVAQQTSPTEVDRVVRKLLDRGWEDWGPTPGGFVLGNPTAFPQEVAAQRAAERCVAMQKADECESLPVFAPGDNIWQAANHDSDAIEQHPEWAVLERAETPYQQGWYIGIPPCVNYAGQGDCDEYPFRTTIQGGPGASLRVILSSDNSGEGTYLQHFYDFCDVSAGDSFVVVPIMSAEERGTVPTSMWCGDE